MPTINGKEYKTDRPVMFGTPFFILHSKDPQATKFFAVYQDPEDGVKVYEGGRYDLETGKAERLGRFALEMSGIPIFAPVDTICKSLDRLYRDIDEILEQI